MTHMGNAIVGYVYMKVRQTDGKKRHILNNNVSDVVTVKELSTVIRVH